MISAADLVRLPYAPDLTEGGIAHLRQSLPRMYLAAEASQPETLRRLVASVAVQLAFRRFLTASGVPFGAASATPFADADRFDLTLGRHRCQLRSFLISHPQQSAALTADAGAALQAPALVPLEQYSAEGQSPTDLYLFAFVTSWQAPVLDATLPAAEAEPPAFLIHLMPPAWMRPDAWIPLGPLALKSETRQPLKVEIVGQDASRAFTTCSAFLPPGLRVQLDVSLYSLTHVHVECVPDGRLGLHSPVRGGTYVIGRDEWWDIWVHGSGVLMVGWITREEFHRRSQLIPAGSRVHQFSRTRFANLSMPMADLKPIGELLERARGWQSAR